MSKLSLKDLVQSTPAAKLESGWVPIEITPHVQPVAESINFKPRKGLKSLVDLNDIKITKPLTVEVVNVVEEKSVEQQPIQLELKEEKLEIIKEDKLLVDNLTDKKTLIDRTVDYISTDLKVEQTFQQPDPILVDKNFDAIAKKIKYIEQFVAKIATHGPGGGAGDVINLDHPVKLVTSNYTFTRRDYYLGVNATSSVTITLPESVGFPGRMVIIKDESGNCSNNPITVDCTVDNDTGGFILAQDNGGIQMIYREGWRIV